MSKSDYVLKLMDRVTAPARAMARSLRALNVAKKATAQAATQAQTAIAATGNAAARAGNQAAAAAAGFKKLSSATRRIALTGNLKELSSLSNALPLGPRYDPQKAGRGFSARWKPGRIALTGSLQELGSLSTANPMGPVFDRKQAGLAGGLKGQIQQLFRWNSATGESIEKWQELTAVFMRTPIGFVLGGLGKIGSVLFDIAASVASLVAKLGALSVALGAMAAGALTVATVKMAAFVERASKALGISAGLSKGLGSRALDNAVELAREQGLDPTDSVNGIIKLTAKGFSLRESGELIRMTSDLRPFNDDPDAPRRIIEGLAKIKSTGTLQGDELQILSEAGVPLDAVYANIGKKLGLDRSGVRKAQESGKIDATTAIDAVKQAVSQMTGGKAAGEVGKEFANQTLDGLFTQLRNAPEFFLIDLKKYLDIEPAKQAIRDLLKAIGSIDKRPIGTFVQTIIEGLTKLIPVVMNFGRGFGSTFDGIIEALSGGKTDLNKFGYEAGKGLGEFFTKVIEWAKSVDWGKVGEGMLAIARSLVSVAQSIGNILSIMNGGAPKDASGSEVAAGVLGRGAIDTILNSIPGVGTAYQLTRAGLAVSDAVSSRPTPIVGGGSVTNNVQVQVTADPGSDPRETGEQVSESIVERLGRITPAPIGM